MSDFDWEKLTVNDLKTELQNRGLPTSGRKIDLINRIKNSGDNSVNEDLEPVLTDVREEASENTMVTENSSLQNGEKELIEESVDIKFTMETETATSSAHLLETPETENIIDEKQIDVNETNGLPNELVEDSNTSLNTDDLIPNEKTLNDNNINESVTQNHNDENIDQGDSKPKIEPEKTQTVAEESNQNKEPRINSRYRTLIIKNVSDIIIQDVKSLLTQSESYMMRFANYEKLPHKFGCIEFLFRSIQETKDAVEMLKNVKIDDKQLELEHHYEEEEKRQLAKAKELRTVYIGNLPNSTTKEMLFVIFNKAKDIEMPLDNTKKPKGHAFLEFESEDEAKKALVDYAGVTIDDGEASRKLILRPFHPTTHRSPPPYKRRNSPRRYEDKSKHTPRYERMNNSNRKPPMSSEGPYYSKYRRPEKSDNFGINPHAAMNLIMGVSRLISQQQSYPPDDFRSRNSDVSNSRYRDDYNRNHKRSRR